MRAFGGVINRMNVAEERMGDLEGRSLDTTWVDIEEKKGIENNRARDVGQYLMV
jgi:hypothetical protein